MNLSNRTILVIGGTCETGNGLVEDFYRANGQLIICRRDLENLTQVENKFPVTRLRRSTR